MTKIAAIILCAGNSSRFKQSIPKPFYLTGEKSAVQTIHQLFSSINLIDKLLYIIKPSDENILKDQLGESVDFCFGGLYRAESVMNAAQYLEQYKPDYILVHDAARPFVSEGLILSLIDGIKSSDKDIIIPILEINDSVLTMQENGTVEKYEDRTKLRLVQTPQIMKFVKYLDIIKQKNYELFTDEGSIFLDAKMKIGTISGEAKNKKITYLGDLNENK